MSLLEKTPIKMEPFTCGACRHWAPWLRQEFLGTCGGPRIGQCTDSGETCDGFTEKGAAK